MPRDDAFVSPRIIRIRVSGESRGFMEKAGHGREAAGHYRHREYENSSDMNTTRPNFTIRPRGKGG